MKRILERAGRLLPAAAAVVAVCAVLPALMLRPPAVEAAAWGLSFRADGQTPVGNAGREELRRYDAAYAGSGKEPVIYLTFDAGYEKNFNKFSFRAANRTHGFFQYAMLYPSE